MDNTRRNAAKNGTSVVLFADAVKILGMTVDQHLKFDQHVQNVCKAVYYHIVD